MEAHRGLSADRRTFMASRGRRRTDTEAFV
jgi:hypothetical protein